MLCNNTLRDIVQVLVSNLIHTLPSELHTGVTSPLLFSSKTLYIIVMLILPTTYNTHSSSNMLERRYGMIFRDWQTTSLVCSYRYESLNARHEDKSIPGKI
jgi:hypothetical protein